MAITRYESIVVNNVVNGTNDIGEYTTTITPWFNTRGLIHDVANSLRISERYRAYTDLVSITLNYTPNTREMVENQNLYSITWRGNEWRIADIREHNSRMRITFMCFRNDPEVPV
jgi:hypothetical protein